MKGIVGRKLGMTQVFDEETGVVTPVTVIQAGPCPVVQIKTADADGYDAVQLAFDEVAEIAATCRFSDCAHESEPGCAVRLAIADGRIDQERLESFRKLQREQARVARQEDPRARAESRRTWKLIHKSVNEHMKRKYGDDR